MQSYGDEGGGLDIRRYLLALLRFKWLLLLSVIVGLAGAYGAWSLVPVSYSTEGNLWIEAPTRDQGADVSPIRAATMLESNAWIELLRSFSVLDTVVIEQGLYVQPPAEFAPAFTGFSLAEEFVPGGYELRVGAAGEDFVLVTNQGALVQQANFGVPIGENVGFRWQPAPGSFPSGRDGVVLGPVPPRRGPGALRSPRSRDRPDGEFPQPFLERLRSTPDDQHAQRDHAAARQDRGRSEAAEAGRDSQDPRRAAPGHGGRARAGGAGPRGVPDPDDQPPLRPRHGDRRGAGGDPRARLRRVLPESRRGRAAQAGPHAASGCPGELLGRRSDRSAGSHPPGRELLGAP